MSKDVQDFSKKAEDKECAALKCAESIPVGQLLCTRHWHRLPAAYRSKLWVNSGEVRSMKALKAVSDAVRWIAIDDGWISEEDSIPTMKEETLF